MARAFLVITSLLGLVGMSVMAVLVLMVTNATDGSASAPIALVGGLGGFLLAALASVVGYHRPWFAKAAALSIVLLAASAVPWLGSGNITSIGMLIVAAVLAFELWRNHNRSE